MNEYAPSSEGQTRFSCEANTITATALGTLFLHCGAGILTELQSSHPDGGPELSALRRQRLHPARASIPSIPLAKQPVAVCSSSV